MIHFVVGYRSTLHQEETGPFVSTPLPVHQHRQEDEQIEDAIIIVQAEMTAILIKE